MKKNTIPQKIYHYFLFVAAALAIITLCMPQKVYAKEAKKETDIPCVTVDTTMYQGEVRYLDIKNVGGASTVKISSSAPKVIEATKRGRLTAKKSGKAIITITMKRNSRITRAKLNVTVKYSSFDASGTYGAKIKLDQKNKKFPRLNLHIEQKEKTTQRIKLSGLSKSAKITYTSKNPDIAAVSSTGLISAQKSGKTLLYISIKQGKKTYTYNIYIHVTKQEDTVSVSQEMLDEYIGDSAFVGSSISVGQQLYFDSQGNDFLGSPTMLVRESYSFIIDGSSGYTQYKPTYKGVTGSAADLIKKSKVKRAFICMGTNDLANGLTNSYNNYVSYLTQIRKKNPNVILFIQSMPPMYKGSDIGELNNENIDKFNAKMKAYCATQPDMYFIDLAPVLEGADGTLRPEYCSDKYVHITMAGYKAWTDALCDYMSELLLKETLATDAVRTASGTRLRADYNHAKKLVNSLNAGSVKTKLTKQLNKIKKKGLK